MEEKAGCGEQTEIIGGYSNRYIHIYIFIIYIYIILYWSFIIHWSFIIDMIDSWSLLSITDHYWFIARWWAQRQKQPPYSPMTYQILAEMDYVVQATNNPKVEAYDGIRLATVQNEP